MSSSTITGAPGGSPSGTCAIITRSRRKPGRLPPATRCGGCRKGSSHAPRRPCRDGPVRSIGPAAEPDLEANGGGRPAGSAHTAVFILWLTPNGSSTDRRSQASGDQHDCRYRHAIFVLYKLAGLASPCLHLGGGGCPHPPNPGHPSNRRQEPGRVATPQDAARQPSLRTGPACMTLASQISRSWSQGFVVVRSGEKGILRRGVA